MLHRLSAALAVCLAAALALASVTLAVGRHAPYAAVWVELCLDGRAQSVPVDSQGRPVAPVHPCPDCLPAGLALAVPPAPAGLPRPSAARARRGPRPRSGPCPPRRGRGRVLARAPPLG